MKKWVRKQCASADSSIRQIMRVISDAEIGVAVIIDKEDHLLGYVTDSDIRRAILNEVELSSPVSRIMVQKPVTIPSGLTPEQELELLKKSRVNRAPVVDADGRVTDIALKWRLQEKISKGQDELDFAIRPAAKRTDGKSVSVIGAGGYVGSVLCRELLSQGYHVRGVDRFLFGDDSLNDIVSHANFELVRGDIRNLDVLVDSAFGVDAVINLAAIVGDPACDLDVNHTIMINYFSAKAAADAARHCKVGRYLFASTAAVYGASSGMERLTEESPVAPVSLYAQTKLKSEAGILSLKDKDFSPCVFRLGTVYGLSPRMRFDLVVNLFAMHAFTKKKLTVFGGTQWRPYVHVRDIAKALLLALKADRAAVHGEIYNLGSDDLNLRVIDLANKVAGIFPGTEVIHQTGDTDQRDYNVSFEKIRRGLGFTADWNIERAVGEIKQQFDEGVFPDFLDKKYSNVKQQEHMIFG